MSAASNLQQQIEGGTSRQLATLLDELLTEELGGSKWQEVLEVTRVAP